MADTFTPPPLPTGFGNIDPKAAPPQGPSAWDKSNTRLKREQATSTTDYMGSMWRQDGVMDGLVAHYVGSQMTPDPAFNPYTNEATKAATEGVAPEFHSALYGAVSGAHQQYIRNRLLEKQTDLQRLGDLGVPGTIGRFALGAFMPENFLTGFTAGLVGKGVRTLSMARSASQVGQAAAAAEVVATSAASRAGARGITAGITFGAAENTAIEATRQSVNFEDDKAGLLMAGLMGAGFATPFVLAGTRQASKVATVARAEADILESLRVVHEGGTLTPEQGKLIRAAHQTHRSIGELEAGRITPEEFEARELSATAADPHGPFEPPEVWMQRNGERVKADAQAIIADMSPGSTGRATGKAPLSAPQKAASDEAIRLETLTNFPADKAPEAGPGKPLNAMEQAFAAAMKKAGVKAPDVPPVMTAPEAAAAALKKAQQDAAWASRQQGPNVAADQERMIRAREITRMAQSDPMMAPPARAPEAPVLHAQEAPATTPAVAPVEAPIEPPPSPFINQSVTWTDRAGDLQRGIVKSVNDSGFLQVETDEGIKAVHPTRVDEHAAISGMAQAPEGFLPGSVGAAQVHRITGVWEQRTAMSMGRLDFFAQLNRSESLGVRELAFKLIKDAIRVDKDEAQGWTASELKSDMQRRIGGNFHVALREAEREAIQAAQQGMMGRGEFLTTFRELVARYTRGDLQVLADNPALAPAITKASGSMKKAYSQALDEAKRARVKGADLIPADEFYVSRLWDHEGLMAAIGTHGEHNVVRLIADAIQVPGHVGDMVKAKHFLNAVKRLGVGEGLDQVHLAGRDMHTLRAELDRLGVRGAEQDSLIDVLFDARAADGGDAGRAGPMKFRFDLNEAASSNLSSGTLRIADLLHNDPRALVDGYLSTMGGHTGLAKVGIDSTATFEAKLKAITDEAAASNSTDLKRLQRELRLLRDVHAHIVGKPMSTADYSSTARFANALRGYTRAASLGQLGIAAAFEAHKAVVMMGSRAMWQSMPSLRNFVTALRQGYVPDKRLARDVMGMTGFGSELAHSYVKNHTLEGGYAGGFLSRMEASANKLSHASDLISGNASFTSLTRSMAAQAAVRQAFDFSNGKALPAKLRERWVSQGLDANEIDVVLKDLKDHADHQDGHLDGIRYEEWQRSEPETYEKFRLFVNRQAREAIQDHDIGETMPWMHTTIGKIFGELRTFMLVGHAKNFLKNAELRDATALQGFFIGFLAESLAYSLQSSINHPDKLAERLTPENIARAAFMRMSMFGSTSLLAETAYGWMTNESLAQPGFSVSGNGRSLLQTPSYTELTRLGNLPQLLTGFLPGTHEATQKMAGEGWKALPFARLYGMPLLGQHISEMFPKADPDLKQVR